MGTRFQEEGFVVIDIGGAVVVLVCQTEHHGIGGEIGQSAPHHRWNIYALVGTGKHYFGFLVPIGQPNTNAPLDSNNQFRTRTIGVLAAHHSFGHIGNSKCALHTEGTNQLRLADYVEMATRICVRLNGL